MKDSCSLAPNWPSFSDLVAAYRSCSAGKAPSIHQTRFEKRLLGNLIELHLEIHRRQYKPSRSTCFVVTDPKPREIFAAHFRDRIVHHLIVAELEKRWEPKFSNASFACRRGRGTHGALKDFQRQIRSISRGGQIKVWALQLDLAAFFVSIDRPVLCDLILKEIRHPILHYLSEISYMHDARKNCRMIGDISLRSLLASGRSWFDRAPHEGLPIGSLTSQFASNVYLSGVDHFILRQLKPQGYLRYMDDLTLIDCDRTKLLLMEQKVDQWLKDHRHQRLNPNKTHLTRLDQGIQYLGCRLVQNGLDVEPLNIYPTAKKKWKFICALQKIEKDGVPCHHILDPMTALRSRLRSTHTLAGINSSLGQLRHGKSFQFRRQALVRAKDKIEHLVVGGQYEKITVI